MNYSLNQNLRIWRSFSRSRKVVHAAKSNPKIMAYHILKILMGGNVADKAKKNQKLDVLPVTPGSCIPSRHLRNMILGGQFPKFHPRLSIGANRQDLLFAQFAHAMSFAAIIWCHFAPFSKGIFQILANTANKQMIRSHALGNIAFVKYMFAEWNRTKMQDPRCLVGTDSLSFFIPDSAISGFHGTDPKPAIVSFMNLFPESLFQWFFDFRHRSITNLAAIFTSRITGGYEVALAN